VTRVDSRQQPEVEELLAQLAGTDTRAAFRAALELGDRREYGAVPALLETLDATADNLVRNGAAIALSDMQIPEAFDVIATLLGQERTRGARGTLLYALEPYDCSPILPLLVELVIADTYESAREAASCIVGIHAMVSDELWAHLKLRLKTAYEAQDPQYAVKDPERRGRVIRVLLEFFEENSNQPE
jgi:HEAT repeat protein